jgi:ureidoglycolate lyase
MSPQAVKQIQAEPLRAESFAPFGKVIEQPARGRDAGGDAWSWWGEMAFMACDDRPYGIGHLLLQPGALRFDWIERHMKSPELLVPMGGDCLFYVAPPQFMDEPAKLPPFDTFRVFRAKSGQGVLLDVGVWHGVPLAVDADVHVTVLLLQGTGATDLTVVRFEDSPFQIAL